MVSLLPPHLGTRLRSGVLLVALLVAAVLPASPALAHEEGESEVAYVLIQQALSHLAHDLGHRGMDEALEKVGDALEAKDSEGVDLAMVKRAEAALEADDVVTARQLLQNAITEAVHALPRATGDQTGTTAVGLPLRGRGDLSAQDWGFTAASLLLLVVGGLLAIRYRPKDSLRQLRATLTANPAGADDAGVVS